MGERRGQEEETAGSGIRLWGSAEKSECVDEIVESLLLSVEKSVDDGRLIFFV